MSGGIPAWIVCLIIPFMNTFKKGSDKPIAFVFLLIIGGIIGFIGMNIPTIYSRWFNFIGFPIFQIVIFIVIALLTSKRKGV